MRLVLDTNVVVSAFLWNGAPAKLLQSLIMAEAEFFSSQLLLDELEATLSKEKLVSKIRVSGLSSLQWMALYASLCTIIQPAPLQPIAPDPDDDWVIATALSAQADMIVTGDKPFLRVGAVGTVRSVTVGEALGLVGQV
jgi:uncharacterized protein